jgi:predicted secreted hydrolase
MRLVIIIVGLLIVSGFMIAWFDQVEVGGEIRGQVDNVVSPGTEYQFARADRVRPITFPQDLGEHRDYRAEWWYYTGNLSDASGQRFGFQLTFFRRAITPNLPARSSEWATHQVYFAHFTITDVAGGTFNFHERYSRGSPELAGAQSLPYRVWIDDWSAQEVEPGQVRLQAKEGNFALNLLLQQAKPPVLHGNQGLSQKSEEPGNANYYYSLTNNPSQGTVTTPRGTFEVTGNSWKDHEWGTSDLGPEAVGWDWYSLQLEDGREVMYFHIRREDGGVEPVSSGTLVNVDGTTRHLAKEDVQIKILDQWASQSGATYPAEWQLSIPSEGIDLHIKPLLAQQELQVAFTYWEGAVRLEGTQTGYGYIEMTGYYDSMRGRF